jgi:hypothetical protein
MIRPRRHGSRRLQFGLRKLLLWTAVVAVLLGILKMVTREMVLLALVIAALVIISELFE